MLLFKRWLKPLRPHRWTWLDTRGMGHRADAPLVIYVVVSYSRTVRDLLIMYPSSERVV
jgi:hypothetical protein